MFFFQAEDGIRDKLVTGVQTCALPISRLHLFRATHGRPPCRSVRGHAPVRRARRARIHLRAARPRDRALPARHSRTRRRDLDARPPPARAAPHPSLVASGLRRACGGNRLYPNARRLVRYRERGRGVLTPPYRRGLHVLRSWAGRLEASPEVGGGPPPPASTNLPNLHNLPFVLIHNSTSCGWARQW